MTPTPVTVTTATGQQHCACGTPLVDTDVTPRYGSSHGTVYATALCTCGLAHYVEVSAEIEARKDKA